MSSSVLLRGTQDRVLQNVSNKNHGSFMLFEIKKRKQKADRK